MPVIHHLKYDHWPVNVRELENVIERAVIVTHAGRLRLDLPDLDEPPKTTATKPEQVTQKSNTLITESERVSRDRMMIIQALGQAGARCSVKAAAPQINLLMR